MAAHQRCLTSKGDQPLRAIVAQTNDLSFSLNGAAMFELHNALMASAIAIACGIDEQSVSHALKQFRISTRLMPGSFNIVDLNGATAVVDRLEPSWFLRSVLRAIRDRNTGRLITVAGRLSTVPESDVSEVGRLIGRSSDALILHSLAEEQDRSLLFRHGYAQNDVPPPILRVPTELRAVRRALSMVKPRDYLLILAVQPLSVLRALARAKHTAGLQHNALIRTGA